jgi:outer membrane protein, heavy metal efflux system
MNRLPLVITCLFLISGCTTTSDRQATGPAPGTVTMAANAIAGVPGIMAPISESLASPIEDLTLADALHLAEAHRPELEALRRRVGMAEGEAHQAGLWPNPTLSIGVEGYTPNRDGRPPDLAPLENAANIANQILGSALWVPSFPEQRRPDQLQQLVAITQPLPISGTPRLARHAGMLEAAQWRHEYERARLELHVQVKKAFDEVIYRQEILAATTALEQTLAQILGVTRLRLEAGDIAEVELIKGEAGHERFALEVETAGAELDQATMRLARVLGDPALAVLSVAGAALSQFPEIPEVTLAKLGQHHPQVKVWETAVEAAEAQAAVTESRRWPVPTLGIGYRHYESSDQDTFDVSLQIELPLFDRKQGDIRAAREKARYEAASAAAERNAVHATLGQTIAAYTSHRRRAEAYQQRILPKMDEALSIARTRFEAGDTGMLEVLDAYRSLAEARLAYLQEAFQTRSAYYELEYFLLPATP